MLLRMHMESLRPSISGRSSLQTGLYCGQSLQTVAALVQVSDARRVSTVGPRRSSVVVSQELGAVLGKPNGLATDAVSSSDARDVLTLGRLQGHAFFPELGPLTKVRPVLTTIMSQTSSVVFTCMWGWYADVSEFIMSELKGIQPHPPVAHAKNGLAYHAQRLGSRLETATFPSAGCG